VIFLFIFAFCPKKAESGLVKATVDSILEKVEAHTVERKAGKTRCNENNIREQVN
jgi:hypothetical protein